MKPPQPVTPRIPVAKPATREAKTRLQNPHVLGKGYCLTWCVNGGKRQHLPQRVAFATYLKLTIVTLFRMFGPFRNC